MTVTTIPANLALSMLITKNDRTEAGKATNTLVMCTAVRLMCLLTSLVSLLTTSFNTSINSR